MPFGGYFDSYYSDVIRPAVQSVGVACVRADEIYGAGAIIKDIYEAIAKADICLVDVTDKNPNVSYELGMAHALGKPAVLVTQRIEDIPFDYRHLRAISYGPKRSGWEKAFQESIARTVSEVLKNPSEHLALKGQASGLQLANDRHPVNRFLEANILPLLSQPYRENVEARVDYSESNDPRFLNVVDEVTYKCRAVGGSIDRSITWSFIRGEHQEMKAISITIKKPTGETKELLYRNDFAATDPDSGFKFAHKITDDWNIDGLLVVIEAHYVIPFDHFISWEMPKLTNGFTLTITYPRHLKIFHMPYLNAYSDDNDKHRPGFFSYKFYTWVLPNEGLAWQFSQVGGTHG